jgi:hypothetical protein
MRLAIDPSAFESTDIGKKQATLEMEHETAVEHVREAFISAGIGVATQFSASELLHEKIEAGRIPMMCSARATRTSPTGHWTHRKNQSADCSRVG